MVQSNPRPTTYRLLPETLEETRPLQLLDIAVVVIGAERSLLRGRRIDELQADKLLGKILENLRRHARIFGKSIESRLVTLFEHRRASDLGVLGEQFNSEVFVIVNFFKTVVHSFDETFHEVGVFLGVGAARDNTLLDEANVHIADLFDAYQLAKALFAQHDALRRGNHRARDGVRSERGHRFRVTAGLDNDRVRDVGAIQYRFSGKMRDRSEARDADTLAAQLRNLGNRRLNVQGHTE